MKRFVALILALALAGTLAACGKAPEAPNMEEVYQSMTQAVNLPEMITLNEDRMLDYCGIASEDVKQAVVVICADSLRTDEIWLLEAVDASALNRLETMANNRLKAKAEESITYSPQQYAVVEKAQLIRTGNCLALLVSPDVDALKAEFSRLAGL